MRVGLFYFPTDYGIDIRELAQLRSVASSHCSCQSTLTFPSLVAPHTLAVESYRRPILIRTTRSSLSRLPLRQQQKYYSAPAFA